MRQKSYFSFRWSLLSGALLLWLGMSLAMAAVPHESATPAYAEEQTILQMEKGGKEPGWWSPDSGQRHIDRHYIVPPGNGPEPDVILQRGGNTWRVLRNGPLATATGVLLLGTLLLIYLFYRWTGPSTLSRPETGRKILRFPAWDRIVHWTTAIAFLLLALTGLIIMFGKVLLLPWMGHVLFSWVAIISKYVHNFTGPFFILCSVVMFFTFLRKNFFHRWDWEWIRKGGGLLSHDHVPAGYFNAGEKLWFWLGVVLLGLVVSVTGLVLNFVNFGQSRYVLQWANYLHIAGSTFYIMATMGHIYIGTLGTPGAYQAMRHGSVDEEWAREHHELWYEAVQQGEDDMVVGQRRYPQRPVRPVSKPAPRPGS